MQVDIVEFGSILASKRVELGIKQVDLEEMTGVNRNIISNIECGKYSKGITEKHRIIATHFGSDIPQDESEEDSDVINESDTGNVHAINRNGNELTEIAPAHIIRLHQPAGFDPETDALITCLLALEPLDTKQAARTIDYLKLRFGD